MWLVLANVSNTSEPVCDFPCSLSLMWGPRILCVLDGGAAGDEASFSFSLWATIRIDPCQPIIEINICFVKLLGYESKFIFFVYSNALVYNIRSTNFLLSFDNNLGHRVIEISFKLNNNNNKMWGITQLHRIYSYCRSWDKSKAIYVS